MAGYLAAMVASPRHLRAAGNVAIGCELAFGLQNVIDYGGIGYPAAYFAGLPVAAAAAALPGGTLRAAHTRRSQGA